MADNPLPRYFFGVPPREYDPNYMRELVRAFSLFQEQLTNPGKVTANELNLLPEGGGIRQFSNNAEAYAAGELKHGPLAIVDENMPVVAVAPNNVVLEKLKSNLEEVKARGGKLYIFADKKAGFKSDEISQVFEIDAPLNPVAPILFTIPLQLLAEKREK